MTRAARDFTDHNIRKAFCMRSVSSLVCLAAVTLVLVGIVQPAAAAEVAIGPGGIHVERKDASAGNTLGWEWHASSDVLFSITRSSDASTVLFSSRGMSNSSTLTIPADDTYLLLWQNQEDSIVTLDFSVYVDAGSGPVLIILLVAVAIIGTLALIYYLVSKRDRTKRSTEQQQPRIAPAQTQYHLVEENPHNYTAAPYQQRPSTFPFPIVSPIFAGDTYTDGATINCPYCSAIIPAKSKFCIYCLGKLQ